MIGGLLAALARSAWPRAALRYGVTAFSILLFLLALRRSGERVVRLAERLETREKANEVSKGCWRWRLAVLVIGASWLTGCATADFETRSVAVCPSVLEYRSAFQARAAEEMPKLPDGSAVVEIMADYAVMRDQARVCRKLNS